LLHQTAEGALVSIVVPVFQCNPDHLRLSLKSLFEQTYDNLEIVLVIDSPLGRRDIETFDVLTEFQDDHRLRIFERKHDRGFCSALNSGILHSNGDLVGRLDADDYSEPDRIERQIQTLKESNLALIGTWGRLINGHGYEIAKVHPPVTQAAIRQRILLHNPFIHSSILLFKELFRDVGLYDQRFEGAEDYDFYLRLISKGYACANLPSYLTKLRDTPRSITRGYAWRGTRVRYLLTKWKAISELGYTRGWDVVYAILSLPSMLISPELSGVAKKAAGWYS